MSAEKTRAIVLRLVEFSESSYIATLFTEDFGKITGLAKGARRQKSAFENALDLLAVSRVVFLRKSSEGMDLLTEAKLERRFRASSRDLRRLYAGYYVAELLQALTDERDPHESLFGHALRAIEQLDGNGNVQEELLRFELAALRELGHEPILDRCVECGKDLTDRRLGAGGSGARDSADNRPLSRRRVAFGQLAGGALCEQCRPGQRHVISLSSNAVQQLRRLSQPDDTEGDTEESTEDDTPSAADRRADRERLETGSSATTDAATPASGPETQTTLQPAMEPRITSTTAPTPAAAEAAARKAASGELRGMMNNLISHRIGRRPRMYPFLARLQS